MKKILLIFFMLFLFISCSKKDNKIEIVLDWTPNTNHTGLFVAKEKGYFDEYGLNVEIVQPPEGSTTQLIGAGHAEYGISFQDTLAKYFAKDSKLPVTAVATILKHNTSGILSLKDKNITRPKDLENKKYGTWEDPIEQAMVKYIVEKDGGNPEKIEFIPYQDNVVISLQKFVDTAWVYYAWDGIGTKVHGLDTNFIRLSDIENKLDYYTPVIIANNDYLKNNKEEVKKVLKAIKKGYEYSINNPVEATNILLKYNPELDEKLVLESQKWINKEYITDGENWGTINEDRWNNFYDWLYDNNLIENKIEKNYGFTNEYLED